jgi:hypothetical protein
LFYLHLSYISALYTAMTDLGSMDIIKPLLSSITSRIFYTPNGRRSYTGPNRLISKANTVVSNLF